MVPVVEEVDDCKKSEQQPENRPKTSRTRSLFRSRSTKPEGRKSLPEAEDPVPVVDLQHDSMPVQRYSILGPTNQELRAAMKHTPHVP